MSNPASLDAIYRVLTDRAQGATASEFAALLSQPLANVEAVLREGFANGTLETWPFWPARIRATRNVADTYLHAVARLRDLAWPVQKAIGRLSGAPVTLHLPVRDGHAVVERCPQNPHAEDVATELAAYAKPHDLKSGATALALKAYMQALGEYGNAESAEIRRLGYCLREGVRVIGSWILSAALTDEHGTPYAALCTFAMATKIPVANAHSSAATMAKMTRELAVVAAAIGEPLAARAGEHIREYARTH